MPRLTIAIPTVNRASLLERAIQSALAQTSQDIEIIVSDNGSTDATPEVIARYAGRGLRTFRRETTIPAFSHGAFILDQVNTEFFVALSDDDYIEPDFAAEILAAFDRHPDASLVYTGCFVHYDDIQVPAMMGPPVESGMEFLAVHYQGKRELCMCAYATRMADVREINVLRPADWVIGDMFFWTKLVFRGPVVCVPRMLSHYILYRSAMDNVSHGTSPIVWGSESRQMADEVMQTARQRGATPEYLAAFKKHSTSHIARSAANQFVWTRIKGASRAQALSWIPDSLPYMAFTWPVISRLGAALILPRGFLQKALLKGAAGLAASRQTSAQN
jgi:glycosyltransferase involved in cell wall biosynthesis